MSRRRDLAAGAVVGAVGVVLLLAPGTPDARTSSAPAEVPATATALTCAAAGRTGQTQGRTVVGRVPASATGRAEVAVRVGAAGRLRTESRELGPSLQPGGGALADGLTVRGEGAAARGLLAGRIDEGAGALAVLGCEQARGSWWFPGAGASVRHRTELFLTNADEGPAVVDVRLHGASGTVVPEAGRGITLAPGESRRLDLVDLGLSGDEVTVEVSADRGRVVAAALDLTERGTADGYEWLAPAVPQTSGALPALPADSGARRLVVTNTGEEQALVSVEVATADGSFVPLGVEQVSVDPGGLAVVDLGDVVTEEAAVRLSSDGERLVAAWRGLVGEDSVVAGWAAPLGGPATAIAAGDSSRLELVGTGRGAARVVAYAADGAEVARERLDLAGGALVTWKLPPRAAYVVVDPLRGSLAGAVLHSGPGAALQPLVALPGDVLVPVLRPRE